MTADKQSFHTMLAMVSDLIYSFKKSPFWGNIEIADKINKPFTYTWEIKDKVSTIKS